jgi:SanA protein
VKRIGKGILVVLILIIAVNVGLNIWLTSETKPRMYSSIGQLPHNTFALVLGTVKFDKKGGIYSSYTNRINTAAKLYKSGKVEHLLVSSSNSARYGYNASTMKADLVKNGVPSKDILLDTDGIRTKHSILRCKRVFGIDTITIVSQAGHCERALYIARYYGLNAIAYPAPTGNTATYLGSLMHEQSARFVMLYDLYIPKP